MYNYQCYKTEGNDLYTAIDLKPINIQVSPVLHNGLIPSIINGYVVNIHINNLERNTTAGHISPMFYNRLIPIFINCYIVKDHINNLERKHPK